MALYPLVLAALCMVIGTGCKPKEQPVRPVPVQMRKAAVLCFHDVTRSKKLSRYAIRLSDFTAILDELKDFRVVSLRSWIGAENPEDVRPRVVLTFDDGYQTHRELVLPELRQRQMGGTFFFYAEQLKRDKAWAAIASEPSTLFEFGSHSWSHALLRDIPYDALFRELYLARGFISNRLGKNVEAFAWPYGYYNPEGLQAAKSAGFAYQVSVDYRIAERDDIDKVIPRYTIYGKKPVERVRQILGDFRSKMPVR